VAATESSGGPVSSPPDSRIVNALTVDVEDYFQVSAFEGTVSRAEWPALRRRVADNTSRLLDLFAAHGVRATFFVLGWVAEREPALLHRISAEGHEVASHGYWHRLVYEQTPAEFREDVRVSKAVIEGIVGRPVFGYRAPSFSVTERSLWALDILSEEGFTYDASIFPIRHDRYGIPSSPRHPHVRPCQCVGVGVDGRCPTGRHRGLVEVPGSTLRLAGANLPVTGGGYFRLLPYAWSRWGIERLNQREACPAVFYIHPWEIDPEQPRMSARFTVRLRHYGNLTRTARKLQRLLADFRFSTMWDVVANTTGGSGAVSSAALAALSAANR
jgi:polysaccharide deacetylase family protein (PEP-CTERM system associated)